MTTIRTASAIAKKQLALRDHLWPSIEPILWHRKAHKGFTTIPKTMPLILKVMDEMTKGSPVSTTYLALWCATWDDCFVTLSKPAELSYAAGFSGQRGEHTWATRMRKLHDLRFIDIKPGRHGALGYALIFNPHFVIRMHYDQKSFGLSEASFNALLEQALEIGAKDMTEGALPELPEAAKR